MVTGSLGEIGARQEVRASMATDRGLFPEAAEKSLGKGSAAWTAHMARMYSTVGLCVGSSLQHACNISQIKSGIASDEGRCGRAPRETLNLTNAGGIS
jgi:hypothetical protein